MDRIIENADRCNELTGSVDWIEDWINKAVDRMEGQCAVCV